MKRNYANKKSKKNMSFLIVKKILLVIFIFMSLSVFIFKNSENVFLKKMSYTSRYVFTSVFYAVKYPFVKAWENVSYTFAIYGVKDENEKLKEENEDLKYKLLNLEYIKAENQLLRASNKYYDIGLIYDFVTAKTVMNRSGLFSKSVDVRFSKNDNVEKYFAVLLRGKLVGYISDLNGKDLASVLLLNDEKARVPVMLKKNNVRAFVTGNNSKLLQLINIEDVTNIAVGDEIVTSGFGEKMPMGIDVGIVEKIEDKKIWVKPYELLNSQEFLKILIYK